jgi:signal transduction histidine kinase
MRRSPLRRLTIQAALFLGFGVVVGLWVYTGYEFTTRMASVEEESATITSRYLEAQERLTRIRSQVLVASVYVRDALLEPIQGLTPRYERQLEETYAAIDGALREYVPVLDTTDEREHVQRLRKEVDDFRQMTRHVLLARQASSVADVRDLLNRNLVPRREAAIRVSEEVQALNRAVFVQHQTEIARVHRVAERRTWQQVGLALIASLTIGVFISLYAGRLESHLQRQLRANEQSTRDLQYLSSRLMTAQEEERRNVARELHDEVGQALTAVKVELSIAQRRLNATPESGALLEAQEITDGALQTVRDMSQLLHPAALDDLGLSAAVEWQARTFEVRHAIRVDFEHDGLSHDGRAQRLPREVEVAAYRIVQEALTNVAKHSGATACRIRLARTEAELVISIQDDGAGFDLSDDAAVRRGLGLVGMRERASLLSGEVSLASERGGGTRVTARLPLARAVHV